MKIVFVCGYFPVGSGGAEYQTYLIAEYLSRTYQVSFVPIWERAKLLASSNEYKIYPIPKRKIFRKMFNRYFFLDYASVRKILDKINPDIIYQRVGFAYTGLTARYAKSKNKKTIWHVSSDRDVQKFKLHLDRNILTNYLDKRFLEYGIKNVDYTICQTEHQNRLLRTNYHRAADLVVPNFHPRPKKIVIKNLPMKVLWIANIKPLKQPGLFVSLAEKFKKNSDLQFIMVGKSGSNEYQKRLLDRISKLDNLTYVGEKPLDAVNEMLCAAHILVNTSRFEGFPNTFIQAWMRKVPVISLSVDPDGAMERNKIGLQSGTFEQLVCDLERLVQNNDLRENMGQRAQEYAFKNHSIDKNMSSILCLIKKIDGEQR